MNPRNQFRYDPDVGFTFVPDLQVRIPHETGGYLVRTNALGFRSDRTPCSNGGVHCQVFVFGDSFTAGDGVSNGQRFTDVLERLIADIDVHNFGLPGSGTDQQFIAFNKFARHLPCDLVIVAVLVENIRRITTHFRPAHSTSGILQFMAKPYFELQDGKLLRFHDPVPNDVITAEELARHSPDAPVDLGGRFPTLRKLVNSLGLKEAVQRLTAYQPVSDFDSPESSAWLLMRSILLAWREASLAPLLIVPLPLYQHVEETADAGQYQTRFRELASETGLAVHDVLPDLLAYDIEQRRKFRFAKDVHMTPAGHEAVARSLAPAIERLLGGVRERKLVAVT